MVGRWSFPAYFQKIMSVSGSVPFPRIIVPTQWYLRYDSNACILTEMILHQMGSILRSNNARSIVLFEGFPPFLCIVWVGIIMTPVASTKATKMDCKDPLPAIRFPGGSWGKFCRSGGATLGWVQVEVGMGVSLNGGTPKWMVYNGKPY